MPNWLVTGGCGFIGSHLVEALLRRGHGVRVLDDLSSGKKDNVLDAAELVIGDVADHSTVLRSAKEVDGIFHLAAIASVQRCREDWVGSHRVNLTGTISVFDAAQKAQANRRLPVVYASSAAVYGDNPELPLNELARPQPLSAYGADKLGGELHGRVAWSTYGVANIGLRFFNVYGRRQDASSPYSGVIAIFAERLAKGVPIEIFGDGQQIRDFVYVDDVVAHLLAAMDEVRSGARVLNVCTGRSTSILELAHAIARLAGREAEIHCKPARVGDIKASVGDPAAARRIFGLDANTSIADGLRKMLGFADDTRLQRPT